jgi:hypothetical protein
MSGEEEPVARAIPATTPRWLLKLAAGVLAAALALLFMQIFMFEWFRRFHLITVFLWVCGAVALVGVIGALATRRAGWVWLVVVAGGLVALSFLMALSKFNWGM